MGKGFSPIRGWATAIAVIALSLGAAACGSSSSSGSSSNSVAGSVSSAVSSAISSASSSVQSGGGASGFCGQANQAGLALRKEIQGIGASVGSEPSKVKADLAATLSTLKGIQSAAPSQIQPDIGVFVDYMSQFQSVLAKHNYSVMAAVPELEKLKSDEAKIKAASAHLKAWGKANGCIH
jgi:hypothetical protein